MVQAEGRALYNVDRKDASLFLGVSERTVDRYIRSGKLGVQKVGHHVYLAKDELESLKKMLGEKPTLEEGAVVEMTKEHESEKVEERREESPSTLDLSLPKEEMIENLVYRGLYEDAKQELDKKQREVEMLHYRLGKIEYEMQQTVPLLEYSKEKESLEIENKVLKEEKAFVANQLASTSSQLSVAQKVKTVYVILLVSSVFIITLGVLFYVGVYNGTIKII